jgi:hypothetical protein
MKKLFFVTLFLIGAFSMKAQSDKVEQFQSLEQNHPADQSITGTATLKSAARLFATEDDLTSVILIIPADSVCDVLDSDSTYFHVVFHDTEGYIFKRQAVINKSPVSTQQNVESQPAAEVNEPVQEQLDSRFSYLENKYGSNMAARLIAGKIWKGMNSDMVRDSWGTPEKINRTIAGNTIKEEWIFRNTWLYFENNILSEWGPVR